MYLTNRVLNAEQALDWGMVNQIVPQADVRQVATDMALKLAKGPTGAYGNTKRLVLASATGSLESQMEAESRSIAQRAASHDGREGITAFAEKRKPNFIGD
jgi:2-(1,2-epoxy-1,2-dihydrophenyl)acetyl-CoA isomerase